LEIEGKVITRDRGGDTGADSDLNKKQEKQVKNMEKKKKRKGSVGDRGYGVGTLKLTSE